MITKLIRHLTIKEINQNKLFSNVREKRALLIGLLTCGFLFLNYALPNDLFMYVFLVVSVGLVLFSNLDSSTVFLLIFSPFAEILRFSFSGIYFYFIYYFAFLINYFFIKNKKTYSKLLIQYLLFIIFALATYNYSDYRRYVSSIIIVLSYFMLVPLVQNYKKENYDRYVLAFVLSFILSSILGFLRPIIPKLDSTLRFNQVWIGLDSYNRFMGVSWDANIFALFCSLSIILILNTNLKTKYKFLIALVVTYFGLLSFSKMFILLLLLIFLLYILLKLKMNIVKVSVFIMVVICSIYLIEIIFGGQIYQIIEARFNIDDISQLTSGRSDIQTMYLQEIFNNTKTFLIGASYGNENLNGRAAHNTFIQIFYILGLIGTLIFGAFMISVNRLIAKQSNKFSLGINIAPVIICSFAFMALSAFTNHVTYIIFFLCAISLNKANDGG